MNFSDISFIFIFLPIFICIYRLVPIGARRIILALGSIIFYTIGTVSYLPWAILLLLGIAHIEYLCLKILKKCKRPKLALLLKIIQILIPVSILCIFKIKRDLPLGLSFFVFQVISLNVDLWQEKDTDYWEYMSFLFMFNKLIMGPIARYKNTCYLIMPSIEDGLKKYTVGLALKVILADQLATLVNSINVSGVEAISTPTAWLGAIGFSLNLYLDFWGYSLMAVGIGEMLGFRIPDNFNNPYASKTVGEFWRRWHITLGTWFRDYIYIPLGGNRHGAGRTAINLAIVWALTGLWHGNGLNFLIWGLVLYLFILLERFTFVGKLSETKVLGHIYICLLMPVTWMIFAHNSLKEVYLYIKTMFGFCNAEAVAAEQFNRYISTYAYLLIISIFVSTPLFTKLLAKLKKKKWTCIPLLALFWISIYLIYKGAGNPFMYYNF